MGRMDEVLEKIVRLLAADQRLEGVRVVSAYPQAAKGTPLTGPAAALSLKKCSLHPAAFGGYLGRTQNSGERFGRQADVTLRLFVCVPQTAQGMDCYSCFCKLCSVLMEEKTAWQLMQVGCGDLSFQRDVGAFVLECEAQIHMLLEDAGVEDTSPVCEEIVVKGVVK